MKVTAISLLLAVLFTGCTGGKMNPRDVEFKKVNSVSGPVVTAEIAAPISFTFPLNSPLYKNLSFVLPAGVYDLVFEDEGGSYFRAATGKLKITAYGKPRGGFWVPRQSGVRWRVWIHPNYDAAIGIFGAAGAGMMGSAKEVMIMDPIPDEALGAARDTIETALKKANQPPQPTPVNRRG